MLIHNPIFTGSISLNGSDISKVSTVSADSSSFASRITQTESTSSAYVVSSGSFSTRITNTESTASAYILASGSFSTRTTAVEATASQYVTASGSLADRLTSNEAKTGSFATTGSNQFNGNQIVTGSLTATGTIVAQTLVVQTVTSSVVYSSGSNIFGLNSGNTHQFTGSIFVSGSVGIGTTSLPYGNVAIKSNSATSYAGLNVFANSNLNFLALNHTGTTGIIETEFSTGGGHTPLAFLTNGTERMRITTSGSVGIGTNNPSTKVHIYESLTNTSAYLTVQNNRARNAAIYTQTSNGGFYAGTSIGTDTFNYQIYDGVAGAARLTIASDGAATFASSVTANNYYAPSNTGFWSDTYDIRRNGFVADGTNLIFRAGNSSTGERTRMVITQATGYVGINNSSPSVRLNIFNTDDLTTIQVRAETDTSGVVSYVGIAPSVIEYYRNIATGVDFTIQTKISAAGAGGNIVFAPNSPSSDLTPVERMRITKDGYIGIATSGYSVANTLQLGRVFGLMQDVNSGYIQANMTNSGNYYVSQYATRIHLDSAIGEITLLIAGSGTAGNAVSLSPRLKVGPNGFTASVKGASDAESKTFMNSIGNPCGLIPTPAGTTLYLYNRDGGTNYRVLLTSSTYFTGQHGNKPIDSDLKTNIQNYIGMIVSSAGTYYSVNPINQEITTGKDAIQISEALPEIKLTDTDQDKAVWGVITNIKNDNYNTDGTIDTDDSTDWGDRLGSDVVRVNGLGEGAIWITNINGNIENGDYVCSSIIPGYGRKQDDDLLHNYTVAKSTMDCDFDLNNNNLYICEEFQYNGITYKKAFIGCTYHCS